MTPQQRSWAKLLSKCRIPPSMAIARTFIKQTAGMAESMPNAKLDAAQTKLLADLRHTHASEIAALGGPKQCDCEVCLKRNFWRCD